MAGWLNNGTRHDRMQKCPKTARKWRRHAVVREWVAQRQRRLGEQRRFAARLERKGRNAKPNDGRSDRRARPGGRIRPGERGRAGGDRRHSREPRPPRSRMGGPWLQPWGTRIRMEFASRPIESGRAHAFGRHGRTCPFVWMTRSPEHARASRAAAHRQCHPAQGSRAIVFRPFCRWSVWFDDLFANSVAA